MVIAVGLNPAMDRILLVPGFAVGATLKAESVETLPSGKGANVAAVLRLLGVSVRYMDGYLVVVHQPKAVRVPVLPPKPETPKSALPINLK